MDIIEMAVDLTKTAIQSDNQFTVDKIGTKCTVEFLEAMVNALNALYAGESASQLDD